MSVSTLLNTTWIFKDSGIVGFGTGNDVEFVISFKDADNTPFDRLSVSGNSSSCVLSYRYTVDQIYYLSYVSSYNGWNYGGQARKTITITGGTDITNSTLIQWLEANATLQTVSYSITVNTTNLTYSGDNTIDENGTATVTLTASSGYALPSSITVSGASYTYNSSTGVISLSNPTGNVTITANGIKVKTFDLTTLNLSAGTHTIQVKARASGYRDSEFSNSVSYEVQPDLTYLTFSSPSSFTLNVIDNQKYWDGTLEYSTDTITWSTWDGTTTLSSASDGTKHNLYLRGTGNTKITGNSADSTKGHWVLTGSNISCEGNIENLLDYATVSLGNHPTMANYCYYYMFYDCSALISAPELPAITLSTQCYNAMFARCTSLTSAPALPATTLTAGCYLNLFNHCSSLVNAPELPATTLAANCYSFMFAACTALTTPPVLPATTLATSCYENMFDSCSALTTIPKLLATTLAPECYKSMFNACSKIKLSTTQTGNYQTSYRIPAIGTGTTAYYALYSMFDYTGGTFKGTPTINTTYYTSNTIV